MSKSKNSLWREKKPLPKKQRLKNFTLDVLDFFLGIPESLAAGFDRGSFYKTMSGMTTEKELTTSNICRMFNQLKKSGYIETINKNNTESIHFTNKARLALVDRISSRSKLDNVYRFVSFDIPESSRINRNQFRYFIKRLGFKQIQKSLWICNKSIGDLVEIAAYEYKVEEYVVYIAAQNTNIDGIIEKMFDHETDEQKTRS